MELTPVAHAAGSALSNAFACNQIKLAEKRIVTGYMHPDQGIGYFSTRKVRTCCMNPYVLDQVV